MNRFQYATTTEASDVPIAFDVLIAYAGGPDQANERSILDVARSFKDSANTVVRGISRRLHRGDDDLMRRVLDRAEQSKER